MRLSTAIILGDTLKKCDPAEWITPDGSCGCALGGALLAAGVTPTEFVAQYITLKSGSYEDMPEMFCIKSRWPWLTGEHIDEISELYFAVGDGLKTIEDVAAYVRTVEPDHAPAEDKGDEQQEEVTESDDYETGLEMSRNQFGDGGRYL